MKKAWLQILAAVFLIAGATGCAGIAQDSPTTQNSNREKITIALGHDTSATEDSHFQQFAKKFKELLELETNGQVLVDIHANGVLGGEREMTESVQVGTLDMVLTSTGPIGNFVPIVNALDFPFLFRDREHANKVLDGEIGEEMSHQLEQVGFKTLVWGENGFRHITNSKRPIVRPEDMKGIKIRTMENKIHLDSFHAFGADPTPMSFTEVFTSLQQGVIDGQENPLSVIVPAKLYDVQKYLTLSGHFYSAALLLMNKDKYESYPAQVQQALLKSAAAARDYERQFIAKKEEEYLRILKDAGVQVVSQSEYDHEAFRAAAKPVYDQYWKEYGELLEKISALK
ncbi:TRAP transporter substrate-binding protein [Brevibacillus sp. NRS-1366]|uniref:TRAP transporter substrate-binding protein n=1 Tax=Brevibacillus sp. NRS-1366 TaxID=3233899 RepID=UPI003D193F12